MRQIRVKKATRTEEDNGLGSSRLLYQGRIVILVDMLQADQDCLADTLVIKFSPDGPEYIWCGKASDYFDMEVA